MQTLEGVILQSFQQPDSLPCEEDQENEEEEKQVGGWGRSFESLITPLSLPGVRARESMFLRLLGSASLSRLLK